MRAYWISNYPSQRRVRSKAGFAIKLTYLVLFLKWDCSFPSSPKKTPHVASGYTLADQASWRVNIDISLNNTASCPPPPLSRGRFSLDSPAGLLDVNDVLRHLASPGNLTSVMTCPGLTLGSPGLYLTLSVTSFSCSLSVLTLYLLVILDPSYDIKNLKWVNQFDSTMTIKHVKIRLQFQIWQLWFFNRVVFKINHTSHSEWTYDEVI